MPIKSIRNINSCKMSSKYSLCHFLQTYFGLVEEAFAREECWGGLLLDCCSAIPAEWEGPHIWSLRIPLLACFLPMLPNAWLKPLLLLVSMTNPYSHLIPSSMTYAWFCNALACSVSKFVSGPTNPIKQTLSIKEPSTASQVKGQGLAWICATTYLKKNPDTELPSGLCVDLNGASLPSTNWLGEPI